MKTSPAFTCHRATPLLAVALILISVASAARAGTEVLKEVPKDGAIRYGKVVLVDDGTCPKGQIKEITGGSQQKSIARQTRCIKRPAGGSK